MINILRIKSKRRKNFEVFHSETQKKWERMRWQTGEVEEIVLIYRV